MKRISMLSQQSITIICQGAKDNQALDVSCLAGDTIEKKITCKHSLQRNNQPGDFEFVSSPKLADPINI